MSTQVAVLIRTAISSFGQSRLAEAMGISRSRFGRMFHEEDGWTLEEVGAACEHLGLRLTKDDPDIITIDRREYEALRLFARRGLETGEI